MTVPKRPSVFSAVLGDVRSKVVGGILGFGVAAVVSMAWIARDAWDISPGLTCTFGGSLLFAGLLSILLIVGRPSWRAEAARKANARHALHTIRELQQAAEVLVIGAPNIEADYAYRQNWERQCRRVLDDADRTSRLSHLPHDARARINVPVGDPWTPNLPHRGIALAAEGGDLFLTMRRLRTGLCEAGDELQQREEL